MREKKIDYAMQNNFILDLITNYYNEIVNFYNNYLKIDINNNF